MTILKQDYLPGFKCTLQVPQVEGLIEPHYTANCIIVSHTPEEILVAFTVGTWLKTTFWLPTPEHLENLPYDMYLSIREIVIKERVEFLCTI